MIIQTKKHIFYPHIKVSILIIFLFLVVFGLGYLFGVGNGWYQCVDFGLKFVNFDNVVEKELIRGAIIQYKESLGGWILDPQSPWFVNES